MIKFEDGKIEAAPGQIRIVRASGSFTSDPGWRLVAIIPGDDVSYSEPVQNSNGYQTYIDKYRTGAPYLVMRREPDAALEEAHQTIERISHERQTAIVDRNNALAREAETVKERDKLQVDLKCAAAARAAAADALRISRDQVERYEQTLGKLRTLLGDKWFKDNGIEKPKRTDDEDE